METPERNGQRWNAAAYAENGRFVAELAADVVALLAPQPGEAILDLGCGDGALTEQIAGTGARMTGADRSRSMLEAARARGLDVLQIEATELGETPELQGRFDAVFSNAALHWIPEPRQAAMLSGVHGVLRPGGRFVAEMGGQGNIAAIRTALAAVCAPFGLDTEALAASFFPSPARYRAMLEQAGFRVRQIDLIPRPTPLPSSMADWLNTFRNGVLDQLPPGDRDSAVERVVELLRPILSDPDGWTADYVRLRFAAERHG